ncbi:pentapeptide repeat-containing protein [Nocardia colli]|uniref:pentapeptide repeat-containing protein n=1 Tax=Nocardia colli TaxID=2545717 RepID=UPI0035DD6053
MEQLASPALTLRLGGIYTLDRIGAESPRDHGAIVDILCALVRTTLPWPPADGTESSASVPPLRVRAIDAQAAVTVLSRWGPQPQPHDRWPTADLSATDLRMANFEGAHLWRVRLRGANLTDANLRQADLRGADLEDAILGGADLRGATADQSTWWPAGFDIAAAGVVVE